MDSVHANNKQVWLGKETGFASLLISDPNNSIMHSLLTTDPSAMFTKEMDKNEISLS